MDVTLDVIMGLYHTIYIYLSLVLFPYIPIHSHIFPHRMAVPALHPIRNGNIYNGNVMGTQWEYNGTISYYIYLESRPSSIPVYSHIDPWSNGCYINWML